jgi:WASH complex subunit 7
VALENRYPHERALSLTRDIRKLGVVDDRLSYLDKFRQLISEIGNALGYVRMVRTAGMHAASDAVKCVPDLTDIPRFEELAAGVKLLRSAAEGDAGGAGAVAAPAPDPTAPGLSTDTLDAARQLDAVLRNLTDRFSESTDFFQLLVSVFQLSLVKQKPVGGAGAGGGEGDAAGGAAGGAGGEGDKKKGKGGDSESHLRNFFLIVPALTLSFVDCMRNAKDRMEKAVKVRLWRCGGGGGGVGAVPTPTRVPPPSPRVLRVAQGTEAFFSDDGFAMGLAYLLAVLKQDRLFESLHWWEAVARFHTSELASYSAEAGKLGKSKLDADRREELEFKARRIQSEQREFESLFFAFRGARSFFRAESEDDGDDAIASAV